jgi:hypothetical protein
LHESFGLDEFFGRVELWG